MKQMLDEKYSIAWFKLADCISKGEREKALGVYRLLSHSLDDKAYALKLEGDLLHAFNDQSSLEKYEQASFLYRQQKQYKEASSLIEELLLIVENPEKYIFQLADLYKNHMSQEQCIARCSKLIDRLFEFQNVQACYMIMQELPDLQGDKASLLYEKLVMNSIKQQVEFYAIKPYLDKFLNFFSTNSDENRSQQFLAFLQETDEQLHDYAVRFLNK